MITHKPSNFFNKKRITSIAVLAVLLVAICVLPKIIDLGHYLVLFSTIIMYIVLSVSWTIFSGPTGYVSLATAAFFGIGIYTSAIFVESLSLPVLMLLGGIAAFIVAFVIGAITLRLRGVYFTIFSFALVKLLESLILWLEIRINGTRGHHLFTSMSRLELNDTVFYYLLGTMVLLLIATYIIKRSRFGMALTSIGESEDAASHIGINTTVFKILAFAISAFWAGAVGAAWALRLGYIDPTIAFKPLMSFLPILMAIFGGMGTLPGPIIGAAVFTYITELLSTKFPNYSMLGTGAVMVIAILFLPNGIFGLAREIIEKIKKRKTEGVEISADP